MNMSEEARSIRQNIAGIEDFMASYESEMRLLHENYTKRLRNYVVSILFDIVESDEAMKAIEEEFAKREANIGHKECFLYFIENTETNCIKIGITESIPVRFNALQAMNGCTLSLMGSCSFENRREAQEAEGNLHKFFHDYRKFPGNKKSEWFSSDIKKYLKIDLMDNPLYVRKVADVAAKWCEDQRAKKVEAVNAVVIQC